MKKEHIFYRNISHRLFFIAENSIFVVLFYQQPVLISLLIFIMMDIYAHPAKNTNRKILMINLCISQMMLFRKKGQNMENSKKVIKCHSNNTKIIQIYFKKINQLISNKLFLQRSKPQQSNRLLLLFKVASLINKEMILVFNFLAMISCLTKILTHT